MKKTIIAFVGMLCVAMMLSLGMSNVEAANQNQKTIVMLSKKTKKASKKSRKASKKSRKASKKSRKASKKSKKKSKKKVSVKKKKTVKKKTKTKTTKQNTAPIVQPSGFDFTTQASAYGCDVSAHNGDFSVDILKSLGVQFMIIRAGHLTTDTKLTQNINKCRNAGMDFGLYWYIQSSTAEGAAAEAEQYIYAMQANGIGPSSLPAYPIYLDLEWDGMCAGCATQADKYQRVQDIVTAFVNVLHGYGIDDSHIGIYANWNWFVNYIPTAVMDTYKDNLWYAPGSKTPVAGRTFNTAYYPHLIQHQIKYIDSDLKTHGLDVNYYYK